MPSSSRAAASAPASNRVLMTAGVFHPAAQWRGGGTALVSSIYLRPGAYQDPNYGGSAGAYGCPVEGGGTVLGPGIHLHPNLQQVPDNGSVTPHGHTVQAGCSPPHDPLTPGSGASPPPRTRQEGEQHTGPTRSNDNAIGSLGVKGDPTLSPNSVAPTVKTPEMPAIIATIPPSILMTISRYPTRYLRLAITPRLASSVRVQ